MNKDELVNTFRDEVESFYEMLESKEIDIDKIDFKLQDIIGTAYCCGKLDEYFILTEYIAEKKSFIAEIFE